MSLVSIPYAAACGMIIIALMAVIQRRPRTAMGWSIIVTVMQTACVPASELIGAGAQHQLLHSVASFLMLLPLLFPALVWMNAPPSASEPGPAKYASAAAAMVLAGGAAIMALDPFLSNRFTAFRAQFTLFRTEPYTIVPFFLAPSSRSLRR